MHVRLHVDPRVQLPTHAVALCGASQLDPRNASQNRGAPARLATPRNAFPTRTSRTRYAQRPERDSTAGERKEQHAMHRTHPARQTYEIATMCTFQSTRNSALGRRRAAPYGSGPLTHVSVQVHLLIHLHQSVLTLHVHAHWNFDPHGQLHVHVGFPVAITYPFTTTRALTLTHAHDTARARETDYTAKEHDVSTQGRVTKHRK